MQSENPNVARREVTHEQVAGAREAQRDMGRTARETLEKNNGLSNEVLGWKAALR